MGNFKSHFWWDFLAYCTRPASVNFVMEFIGVFSVFLLSLKQQQNLTKIMFSCIHFPVWPYPPKIMKILYFILVNCMGWQVCHNYCVCVCVCDSFFFLLSLFVTVYIFTFNCYTCIVPLLGRGRWGRSCLYFLVWVSFSSFSLQELTCMHCLYLALWTCKVLCGSVLCAI